jgi:tRNA A-37 threonylcarbamoyl transferase component Bud32
VQRRRASHWNARRAEPDRTYFLKWFFHGPWRSPGRAEWENARRVAALGIPTVAPVGWGRHRRGSFIVFEGSPGFPAAECRLRRVPQDRLARLAARLAGHVAALHDGGLCHKDLNVYHILVDGEDLRIIDVGRVASFLRRRWIVKDLASLLDSARREGFTPRSFRHFLRSYLGATRRHWSRRRLIRSILGKAERYRAHNERRGGLHAPPGN